MSTNYTLECVELPGTVHLDVRKKLDAFLQLNTAGRRYVATDAENMDKAIGVLQTVRDNLDCLFMHLSTNPLICAGKSATACTSAASRKRKKPSDAATM
jgi:hypothetical protein